MHFRIEKPRHYCGEVRSPGELCFPLQNSAVMDLCEDTWVHCIVFGAAGNLRFGCPLRIGFSVLIPPIFHVEIGDFVDIKFKHNPQSNPNQRAQHIVTHLRISETPAPHIEVFQKKTIFFYTTGQVRGFDEHNNKPITLLQNDLFGHLIDLDAKLPVLEPGTLVDLRCRFKESPRNAKSTIFVVTDFRNPRMPSSTSESVSSIESRNSQTVGDIPEVALSTVPCDTSINARNPEDVIPAAPSEDAASVACSRKPMNKFASKTKTEMFFTIFNNDQMLSKVKELDKDLWTHLVNKTTTGE